MRVEMRMKKALLDAIALEVSASYLGVRLQTAYKTLRLRFNTSKHQQH